MVPCCYVTYVTTFVCLYAVLGLMLGLKNMLLVFGAVHFGCLLLLLAVCWSEVWADVPTRMAKEVSS